MPIQNLGHAFIAKTFDEIAVSSDAISNTTPSEGGFFGNDVPLNSIRTSLFWDGRETVLSEMVLKPLGNHVEMGIYDVQALERKLSALPYYQSLTTEAFGDNEITAARIGSALEAFISNMTSNDTKLDRSLLGADRLSPVEIQGQGLFFTKYDCNSCHQVQSPTGYLAVEGGFANIGLDANYEDNGLGVTTRRASDNGKFKIPSLRNVELTGPYMHDGRFASLEEVIDHYSEGMEDHPNLDDKLRDASGNARQMNISEGEKTALIAFLKR